jgi:hypothetical protein
VTTEIFKIPVEKTLAAPEILKHVTRRDNRNRDREDGKWNLVGKQNKGWIITKKESKSVIKIEVQIYWGI